MRPSKNMKIAGWVITLLIAFMLIVVSGIGKFIEFKGKEEMLGKMGISADLLFNIGILEITLAILYVIPQTSFLGAILLTGYLGGATLTHLRINEPFIMPVIIGVVMWIGCALRKPQIFSLLPGQSPPTPPSVG